MARFIMGGTNLFGGNAFFSAEDSAKVKAFLLHGTGHFSIQNGGEEIVGRVEEDGHITLASPAAAPAEPVVSCTVYIAYTDEDILLSVMDRSVELGCRGIVVYPSALGGAPSAAKAALQAEKWRASVGRMVHEIGRQKPVRVSYVSSFEAAVELAAGTAMPLFLNEKEEIRLLHHLLENSEIPLTASILIGPKEGLTDAETEFAKTKLHSVSLGPRILRCDTAAAAALSAVLYAAHDL